MNFKKFCESYTSDSIDVEGDIIDVSIDSSSSIVKMKINGQKILSKISGLDRIKGQYDESDWKNIEKYTKDVNKKYSKDIEKIVSKFENDLQKVIKNIETDMSKL